MDTANSAAFRSHGPGDIPEDGADNDDDADLPDPASQSMISASDTDASDLSYRPRPQHKEDLLRGVKTILMHPVQGIFKLLESVPSPLSRRRAPRASDGHPMHTPLAAWNDRATSHRKTFFTSLAEICVSSWLNILLLFVPLGIGSYFAHLSPMMIFVSNAIAIIPLSAIMTDATERIAAQAGDTVGALLNISLGNLVELILLVALANNHIRIVQASILGSILVNLLLILGTALLAGSAINSEPTYNTAEAQLLACLLFVSVFTFLMPAAFDHTYKDTTDTAKAVLRMSRLSSILTLLIYVYYFVHELRSRSGASGEAVPTDALDIENGRTSLEVTEYNRNLPDVTLAPRTIRFADEAGSRRPRTPLASHRIELDDLRAAEPDDSEDEALENQRPGSSYQSHSRSTHRARSLSLNSNSSAHEDARRFPRSGLTNLQMLRDSRIDHDQEQLLTQQQQHRHHHHHHHHHHLQTAHSSKKGEMFTCAFVLVLTSVTMSISAEFLVSAIDDVTHQSHLSESVIGLIILPIVGNIAEYVTVVTVAVRDKLDLAIAVSVGSAIQIALCVTPLTVIAGWILRKNLALSFNFFEMATLFGSVLLVNLLILNETSRSLRTSGLKGALMCTCYLIIGLVFAVTVASSSNASVVSVPIEHTYNLPDGFTGNLNDTFAQGTNVSSSHEISSLLQRANEAPIISFDDEFAQIVGSRPTIKLVEERNDIFAFEAGVWVPEKDQVWFTSSLAQGSTIPPVVGVLNLKTQAVWTLNGTSEPIINPNGGYYFDGKVYFGTYPSNDTYRGGIVSVDVETLEVETVVNSYFGIPFNGVDDIVWVTRNGKRQMFFTDLDISPLAYPDDPPKVQLPAGVWRFDPDEKMLQPVISRNELNPNGIRVSPDMKTLYVTDSVPIFLPIDRLSPPVGPGAESWLGPYIYAYDLDENMTPANRRLFGLARRYFADGIHVDDVGRVWTGEGDGIVVRSSQGKTLGIFNGKYFLGRESEGQSIAIANFALAGDTVVVLAGKKLWTVQLSEEIVARDSSIIN